MSQCLNYDDFFPKSNPGQVEQLTLKKTKFESGFSERHMFKICQTVRYFLKTPFLLQIFTNTIYFNVASLFNMKLPILCYRKGSEYYSRKRSSTDDDHYNSSLETRQGVYLLIIDFKSTWCKRPYPYLDSATLDRILCNP